MFVDSLSGISPIMAPRGFKKTSSPGGTVTWKNTLSGDSASHTHNHANALAALGMAGNPPKSLKRERGRSDSRISLSDDSDSADSLMERGSRNVLKRFRSSTSASAAPAAYRSRSSSLVPGDLRQRSYSTSAASRAPSDEESGPSAWARRWKATLPNPLSPIPERSRQSEGGTPSSPKHNAGIEEQVEEDAFGASPAEDSDDDQDQDDAILLVLLEEERAENKRLQQKQEELVKQLQEQKIACDKELVAERKKIEAARDKELVAERKKIEAARDEELVAARKKIEELSSQVTKYYLLTTKQQTRAVEQTPTAAPAEVEVTHLEGGGIQFSAGGATATLPANPSSSAVLSIIERPGFSQGKAGAVLRGFLGAKAWTKSGAALSSEFAFQTAWRAGEFVEQIRAQGVALLDLSPFEGVAGGAPAALALLELLGLHRKWNSPEFEEACAKALSKYEDAAAVDLRAAVRVLQMVSASSWRKQVFSNFPILAGASGRVDIRGLASAVEAMGRQAEPLAAHSASYLDTAGMSLVDALHLTTEAVAFAICGPAFRSAKDGTADGGRDGLGDQPQRDGAPSLAAPVEGLAHLLQLRETLGRALKSETEKIPKSATSSDVAGFCDRYLVELVKFLGRGTGGFSTAAPELRQQLQAILSDVLVACSEGQVGGVQQGDAPPQEQVVGAPQQQQQQKKTGGGAGPKRDLKADVVGSQGLLRGVARTEARRSACPQLSKIHSGTKIHGRGKNRSMSECKILRDQDPREGQEPQHVRLQDPLGPRPTGGARTVARQIARSGGAVPFVESRLVIRVRVPWGAGHPTPPRVPRRELTLLGMDLCGSPYVEEGGRHPRTAGVQSLMAAGYPSGQTETDAAFPLHRRLSNSPQLSQIKLSTQEKQYKTRYGVPPEPVPVNFPQSPRVAADVLRIVTPGALVCPFWMQDRKSKGGRCRKGPEKCGRAHAVQGYFMWDRSVSVQANMDRLRSLTKKGELQDWAKVSKDEKKASVAFDECTPATPAGAVEV